MDMHGTERVAGRSSLRRGPRTYAVVSTFPPTPCGVATYSAALCEGLDRGGDEVVVVRVGGEDGGRDERVVATLSDTPTMPAPDALAALACADVVIVQHECGLYAGVDGDSILEVLDAIAAPTIVVAHTVLRSPTAHQREVPATAVQESSAHERATTNAIRRALAAGRRSCANDPSTPSV